MLYGYLKKKKKKMLDGYVLKRTRFRKVVVLAVGSTHFFEKWNL